MNRIRELHSQGLSIRKIALDVGCSIGAVHKTITSFDNEKNTERGVQLCSN
jgi:hypothetical protein